MLYKVKITPIIPIVEIWKGPFISMEEAWRWVEEHNNPFVDYEVILIDDNDGKLQQETQGEGR